MAEVSVTLDGEPTATLVVVARSKGREQTIEERGMDPRLAESALAAAKAQPWFVRGEVRRE